MADPAMITLRRLGWQWYSGGVVVRVETDRGPISVWVPLETVWLSFASELPPQPGIGCPQTIGGFFSFVKKASRSVKRAARKAVPKQLRRGAGKVLGQAGSYVSDAAKTVSRTVRNPTELAITALNPMYAINKSRLSKDLTGVTAQLGIPGVSQAAQASGAMQRALERAARGKGPSLRDVQALGTLAASQAGAAKLAGQLAEGTRAAATIQRGMASPSLHRALKTGMAAQRKLEQLRRIASRPSASASARARAQATLAALEQRLIR